MTRFWTGVNVRLESEFKQSTLKTMLLLNNTLADWHDLSKFESVKHNSLVYRVESVLCMPRLRPCLSLCNSNIARSGPISRYSPPELLIISILWLTPWPQSIPSPSNPYWPPSYGPTNCRLLNVTQNTTDLRMVYDPRTNNPWHESLNSFICQGFGFLCLNLKS